MTEIERSLKRFRAFVLATIERDERAVIDCRPLVPRWKRLLWKITPKSWWMRNYTMRYNSSMTSATAENVKLAPFHWFLWWDEGCGLFHAESFKDAVELARDKIGDKRMFGMRSTSEVDVHDTESFTGLQLPGVKELLAGDIMSTEVILT